MIAAVAAGGQRVRRGQALEVRARDVVEEQVVLEGEELPEARAQVLLDRRLVRQEPIQRPVQAIVVDPRGGHPEQILERRRAVPVLRDVQLTRRLTQARDHQHRRHLGPWDRLPARRQERGAQLLEAQRPPQRPAEPDIAKRASPLDADSLEPHRDGRLPRRGPSNSSRWSARPVISCARSWARARPSPSSSPRCAAVSCTTFPPRRTERTSRQYVCARPPFRTTVCRRYTPPHPARPLSPERLRFARPRGWHYTPISCPRDQKRRRYRGARRRKFLSMAELGKLG